MLAAFNPAVKSPASPTPEQAAIDQALKQFWSLVERLKSAAGQQQPIHHVEETIFRQLLVMGHSLLQAFLASSGQGDVGPTLTLPGDRPSDPPQVLPRLDEPRSRPYLSIFGAIPITRACYGHGRVEAASLDARLHLPRRQYSYLFQQWLGAFVIDDSHAESIKKLEAILGLAVSVKASEDLNGEQAGDVEPFGEPLGHARPGRRGADPGGDGRLQGGPLGEVGLGSRTGRRRSQGHSVAGGGQSTSWQGPEGQQEADGGGGSGVHDRAVLPHRRRGDRRSDAKEGRRTPPSTDAQAGPRPICWWARWRCSSGWPTR